jgi:hypothetical protein
VLLGDPVKPDPGCLGVPERLADGHRPVDELIVGGHQRDVHPVTGEIAQRQRGLGTGDTAAGDHHSERGR